ncbi:hypothetical protein AVEN_155381-1 [Araneus ventricosus]|uniref:TIL domain-containing protein n=1 Tax=Araneus ventricosus TaxID=182803 RepID=A0A4Y2SNF6_ARAVE|nr:hypothetical protein AVEN_116443-1 [Araneus ventricosus]GBN88950.1 hypothetical protein AVEN_24252-1 [Araneus ventricosus]GBN88951.1 hypothetical protein AVEN_155381-1 [Araneus ventricosus]
MKFLISLLLLVVVAVAQEDQNCPVNKTHGPFDDCPLSCYLLTPRTQPEQCTRRLNIGCKCQEGFVLLEHKVFSSKCIKPEDCPPEP